MSHFLHCQYHYTQVLTPHLTDVTVSDLILLMFILLALDQYIYCGKDPQIYCLIQLRSWSS